MGVHYWLYRTEYTIYTYIILILKPGSKYCLLVVARAYWFTLVGKVSILLRHKLLYSTTLSTLLLYYRYYIRPAYDLSLATGHIV